MCSVCVWMVAGLSSLVRPRVRLDSGAGWGCTPVAHWAISDQPSPHTHTQENSPAWQHGAPGHQVSLSTNLIINRISDTTTLRPFVRRSPVKVPEVEGGVWHCYRDTFNRKNPLQATISAACFVVQITNLVTIPLTIYPIMFSLLSSTFFNGVGVYKEKNVLPVYTFFKSSSNLLVLFPKLTSEWEWPSASSVPPSVKLQVRACPRLDLHSL